MEERYAQSDTQQCPGCCDGVVARTRWQCHWRLDGLRRAHDVHVLSNPDRASAADDLALAPTICTNLNWKGEHHDFDSTLVAWRAAGPDYHSLARGRQPLTWLRRSPDQAAGRSCCSRGQNRKREFGLVLQPRFDSFFLFLILATGTQVARSIRIANSPNTEVRHLPKRLGGRLHSAVRSNGMERRSFMQASSKPVSTSTPKDKQMPGLTFKNSLREWQARYKAQRAARAPAAGTSVP